MRRRGTTCRYLLPPFTTAVITLCAALPLLTAGCGSSSGVMPSGVVSDTTADTATKAVSAEARDAVRRIMPGVGRSAALHTPAAGTHSQSFLSYEGGYEAVVYIGDNGAVTGRIMGPASGLPAEYRLDGDHADVTYQDGTDERVSLL